jgi:hypothetical protein
MCPFDLPNGIAFGRIPHIVPGPHHPALGHARFGKERDESAFRGEKLAGRGERAQGKDLNEAKRPGGFHGSIWLRRQLDFKPFYQLLFKS